MRQDGSGRQRLAEDIDFLVNISPDEGGGSLELSRHEIDFSCRRPVAWAVSMRYRSHRSGPPGVGWSRDRTTMFVDSVGDGMDARSRPLGRRGACRAPCLRKLICRSSPVRVAFRCRGSPPVRLRHGTLSRETEQSNLYRIRLP